MTNQEYARYTGSSYMTTFKSPAAAIAFSLNKYNCGKTKIVMLADGETFGVCQNSLANKFFRAGLEQLNYSLDAMALVD